MLTFDHSKTDFNLTGAHTKRIAELAILKKIQ